MRARAATVLLAALAALAPLLVWSTPAPAAAQASAEASLADDDLGWGESTTLQGSGWLPGETVQVILHAGADLLAEPVAADDGTIRATIRIPEGKGSSNQYALAVQGLTSGGYVEVPLTIRGPEPTMSVAVDQARWGDGVAVTGTRWQPGTTVTISLAPTSQVLTEVTVAGDGRFSATAPIPSDLPSSPDYEVVATGEGVDRLFHYLAERLTIIGPDATASVRDTLLAWGQTTVVHGALFLPGSRAQIHLMPGSILLAEPEVGGDGSFAAPVTIPEDLVSSPDYALLVTGASAASQLAYLPIAVTVLGPSAFLEVTDVSGPDGRALQVTGHRFMRGTNVVLTMLPEFERLAEVTVGPDRSFSSRLALPATLTGPDPHYLVATGQGADGQFAYLTHELRLAAEPSAVQVGAAVAPPGDRSSGRARASSAPGLPSPFDALADGLAGEGVEIRPDAEGTRDVLLALLLLFLFLFGGWFLSYALRHDVRTLLHRPRTALARRRY